MEYTIVGFNKDYGTLVVKFTTTEYPEGLIFNVDIPISNGTYVTGETLTEHIMSFAPVGQVDRILEIKNNALDLPAGLTVIDEHPPRDPILDTTLTQAKEFAQAQIDRSASETRNKFVSVNQGQDWIYQIKVEQAKVFQDANYQGTAPAYITAEATALGQTTQQVTDNILNNYNEWVNNIGPAIEAIRIKAKSDTRNASTNQEIKTIVDNIDTSYAAFLVQHELS